MIQLDEVTKSFLELPLEKQHDLMQKHKHVANIRARILFAREQIKEHEKDIADAQDDCPHYLLETKRLQGVGEPYTENYCPDCGKKWDTR